MLFLEVANGFFFLSTTDQLLLGINYIIITSCVSATNGNSHPETLPRTTIQQLQYLLSDRLQKWRHGPLSASRDGPRRTVVGAGEQEGRMCNDHHSNTLLTLRVYSWLLVFLMGVHVETKRQQ